MRQLIVVGLLILCVFAPVSAQESDDVQEVEFLVTFIPNIQFAPVYLADMYLRENTPYGLDIQYMDENVAVDLIANDTVPFGIISGEQVIMARAAQRPVKYVFEWFQKFAVGLVVPDTVEVETIQDLIGLKIGLPGRYGANYAGLLAILSVNDLTEDDVRLEAIGFAAPDVVCVGGVDVSSVYINNEPLQIQRRIDAGQCGDITSIKIFPASDYGDIVANGIMTNEALISSDPELVQTVVSGFAIGLEQAINNPAQAYLDSRDYVPDLPISDDLITALTLASEAQITFLATEPTREAITASRQQLLDDLKAEFDAELLTQFEVFLLTIELWDADQLGVTDAESWAFTYQLVDLMGNLAMPIDALEVLYTNDFVSVDQE
jgi:NitT/TauT family transport system substrate-binding protein